MKWTTRLAGLFDSISTWFRLTRLSRNFRTVFSSATRNTPNKYENKIFFVYTIFIALPWYIQRALFLTSWARTNGKLSKKNHWLASWNGAKGVCWYVFFPRTMAEKSGQHNWIVLYATRSLTASCGTHLKCLSSHPRFMIEASIIRVVRVFAQYNLKGGTGINLFHQKPDCYSFLSVSKITRQSTLSHAKQRLNFINFPSCERSIVAWMGSCK